MAADPEKLLRIYRQQLEKYESQGLVEKADIQRRLIKRLEEKKGDKKK